MLWLFSSPYIPGPVMNQDAVMNECRDIRVLIHFHSHFIEKQSTQVDGVPQ
jgi:hypothetical protein